MRLVFFTLLAFNVGYLLWQYMPREPEDLPPLRLNVVTRETPTIPLLSEQGPDSRAIEMEVVVANPLSAADVEDEGNCAGLGPFAEFDTGQIVLERMRALDLEVLLRAVDEPTGEFDYRIMLPPAPSLQEAFRRLRELQNRNIDSYVMTKGEDALGISLGVFSTEAAAEQARIRLVNEGYEVQMRRMERLDRRFWLIAPPGGDIDAPPQMLEELGKTFRIGRGRVVCPV